MQTKSPEGEMLNETARERWENEGGRSLLKSQSKEPEPNRALEPGVPRTPEPLPFPALEAGALVLKDLELVRLVDTPTLGKYRIQQTGLGEEGYVFLVTLFGATCSKVAIVGGRKPSWRNCLAAMATAIEREVGYWQSRGEPLPRSARQAIGVTVRETDFALS